MVSLAESMVGDHPARPVLVLSNDPEAGGLAKASAMGIATAAIDHKPFGDDRAGFEALLQTELENADADMICLAGFMRILTAEFICPLGRANAEYSSVALLPKYKGLNTHARALRSWRRGCRMQCARGNCGIGRWTDPGPSAGAGFARRHSRYIGGPGVANGTPSIPCCPTPLCCS